MSEPTYKRGDLVEFRDVTPGHWTMTVLAVHLPCFDGGDHAAVKLCDPETGVSWYCSLDVEPAPDGRAPNGI